MNSFENKSGNFINSIVDAAIEDANEFDDITEGVDASARRALNVASASRKRERDNVTNTYKKASAFLNDQERRHANDPEWKNGATHIENKELYKKRYPDRKNKVVGYGSIGTKIGTLEGVDDYDEFDRLVDEAIEEAEYYDHDDTQVSRTRGKIFESSDFDEYADCDEASEGLFTNDLVASVGKFREVGMSDEESRKAMKVLVVFAISNGMAKSNISKNTTELRKRDMHYLTGNGGFVKSFLSKWYRIADEDDTAKTFSDALNKSWAEFKKMLQDRTDQMRRVEVARAGAANINVNNSNRNYAYSSSSVFESVNDSDMVLEALFEKRTLDTVLQTYLKQLEKKLNTIEACDKFLALIKQDQAKFNNALKVCADAKIKLDKGQIDEKQFKNLTKSAAKQIAGYCKTFKLKMSDFGGGGSSAARNITKEDIANFKQYVTGLIAGVRSIKKKRQAMYKEMNRKPGQKSTLRKDMVTANEAAFDDIFLVSDVDD